MKSIEMLDGFNVTTNKKEYHKIKLEEVRQLLDKIYDLTGYYWLLSDRNNAFQDYKDAVKMYDSKTKKELDKLLKLVISGAKREVRICLEIAC